MKPTHMPLFEKEITINKFALKHLKKHGSRRLIPIITRIMNHGAQYHNEVQKLKVTALPLQAFSWKRIGIRKLIKLSKHANFKSYQLCRQGSKAQHSIKPQCALLVILFQFSIKHFLAQFQVKYPNSEKTDLFPLKVTINCKSQAKIANFLTFVEACLLDDIFRFLLYV